MIMVSDQHQCFSLPSSKVTILLTAMFTIPISLISVILNSVKNLTLPSLSSGMETLIRNSTSDFSTYLEEKKDGQSADGTLMMKVYLTSGDSPK